MKHTAFNYFVGLLNLMKIAFAVYASDCGIRQVGQNIPNEIAVEAAFLLFLMLSRLA